MDPKPASTAADASGPAGRLLAELERSSLVQRFHELARRTPELRVLSYMLPFPKLLEWILSVGVARFPELAALVPRLPPEQLRDRVAEKDLELFLWTGVVDAFTLMQTLEAHGSSGRVPLRVLDFGGGCGRVVRHLCLAPGTVAPWLSDVNSEHVAFCRQDLPGAQVLANGVEPPLALPDASFEAVSAFSVFTHLAFDTAERWASELVRLLAPEGLLVLTTHGEVALDRLAREEALQRVLRLSAADSRRLSARLAGEAAVFVPYGDDRLANAGAGARYGSLFLSSEGVERLLARAGASVLEIRPGGLRGWQDLVVARRRS